MAALLSCLKANQRPTPALLPPDIQHGPEGTGTTRTGTTSTGTTKAKVGLHISGFEFSNVTSVLIIIIHVLGPGFTYCVVYYIQINY